MESIFNFPLKNVFIFPLIFFIALIPYSSGSLFDFFLPIIFLFSLFLISKKKIISHFIRNGCLIYISILIAVTLVRLLLPSNFSDNTFILLALLFRTILPISILMFVYFIYLRFLSLDREKQYNFFIKLYLSWFSTLLITFIFSIFQFSKGAMNIGLAFPFYSDGIDRHVFGPAIAFVAITSYIIYSNDSFIKNKFIRVINFIFIHLSLLVSIGSSSRGPLLIYVVFLLTTLIKDYKKINILNTKFINFASVLISIVLGLIVYLRNQIPELVIIINRFFSLFNSVLNPYGDTSRGDRVKDFLMLLQNINTWPFGDITNPLITPDSGPYLLLSNYGLFALISFSIIFIAILLNSKEKIILGYFSALFFQFAFSSETIFIPRYTILISWSFALMFISLYLKRQNQAKNKSLGNSNFS